MGLKVTVTFEATDTETMLDAVEAFADEMCNTFADSAEAVRKKDGIPTPTQIATADGDNWNYVVEVSKKD